MGVLPRFIAGTNTRFGRVGLLDLALLLLEAVKLLADSFASLVSLG